MLKKQNKLRVNSDANRICKSSPTQKSDQFNHITLGAFCVVGFTIIFIIMLINACFYPWTDSSTAEFKTFSPVNNLHPSCTIISRPKCQITCDRLNQEFLTKSVEDAYEKLDFNICRDIINKLEVTNLWVKGETLTPGWLNSTKFKIKSLTLSGENINDVKSKAFSGYVFKQLEILHLMSLNILNFHSDLMEDKPKLTSFSMDDCGIFSIESESLKPVQDTLISFQINRATREFDPENFTGSSTMNTLRTVDLRFNRLLLVNPKSFSSLPKCDSFFLTLSNINTIAPGAFSRMSSLQIIYLDDNNIERITENTFPQKSDLKLYLASNPLICDCDLQWLSKHFSIIEDMPICEGPPNKKGMSIFEVEFCHTTTTETTVSAETTTKLDTESTSKITKPTTRSTPRTTTSTETSTNAPLTTTESTTDSKPTTRSTPRTTTSTETSTNAPLTTTESTTDSKPTTTTELPLNYIPIACNRSNSQENNEIARQTIEFNVESNKAGSVNIEIVTQTKSIDSNYFLMWFKKNAIQDVNDAIKCTEDLEKYTVVEDLDHDVYSFCFVEKGENTISPLNCRALVVKDVWDNESWLTNGDIMIVSVIVGVCFLILWILGGICIFLIVRKNPSLLRGSKRIVIVKKRQTEAIVIPKFVEKCESKPEQYSSTIGKSSSARHSFMRPLYRRSVSETSIVSGSYISPNEPTSAQLLTWRLERLRGKNDNSLPPVAARPTTPDFSNDYESISCVTEV